MLFEPTFTPFTCHWNAGLLPPFECVAVYATMVPWQTVVAEAVMETLTGKDAAEIITIWFDETGLPPLTQEALEVSKQVTMSPFEGKYVKVGLGETPPRLTPLTCH